MHKILLFAAFLFGSFGTATAADPATTARKVLDALYATNGNFKFKKPNLVLTPENKKVAAYMPAKNTIFLDEKAYWICSGMGRDSLAALAFVLGHELAHNFQTEVMDKREQTNFLAYDRNYAADVRVEKSADVQGILNAYLAGYPVLKVMPRVLESIYREYGLEGKALPGYPSLEERMATNEEVRKLAENLLAAFESANYLLAVGHPNLALAGYEYVLQYYQGKEVYNNLGVAYTLNAQEFWDPVCDNFVYPIEADWGGKLARLQARGQDMADPATFFLRELFLQKAAGAFREATALDPQGTTAHINIVCVLDMLGKPQEALDYYEKNLKKAKGQEQDMAEIALAISYALLPGLHNRQKATDLLQSSIQSNFALGALYGQRNLDLLEKRPAQYLGADFQLPERFRQLAAQIAPEKTANLEKTRIDPDNDLFFAQKRDNETTTCVFSNERGNLVSLVRFQNSQVRNLSILAYGENFEDATYPNLVPTKDGFYLQSPADKLVLKVDAKGHVLEMVKYVEH